MGNLAEDVNMKMLLLGVLEMVILPRTKAIVLSLLRASEMTKTVRYVIRHDALDLVPEIAELVRCSEDLNRLVQEVKPEAKLRWMASDDYSVIWYSANGSDYWNDAEKEIGDSDGRNFELIIQVQRGAEKATLADSCIAIDISRASGSVKVRGISCLPFEALVIIAKLHEIMPAMTLRAVSCSEEIEMSAKSKCVDLLLA